MKFNGEVMKFSEQLRTACGAKSANITIELDEEAYMYCVAEYDQAHRYCPYINEASPPKDLVVSTPIGIVKIKRKTCPSCGK